jgi:hypothetical protein
MRRLMSIRIIDKSTTTAMWIKLSEPHLSYEERVSFL